MKPDLTNYEIWIIDYLDGKLDQGQVSLLFEFLEDNPAIKEEFRELTVSQVTPPVSHFRYKDSIRKSVHDLPDEQFELLCAAHAENDLSPEEVSELRDIIDVNEERRKTHDLYFKLRLSPPQMVFDGKKRLYRLSPLQKGTRIIAAGISIAATIIIIFTLLGRGPEQQGPPVLITVSDTVIYGAPAETQATPAEAQKQDVIVSVKTDKPLKAGVTKKEAPLMAEYKDMPRENNDSIIKTGIPEIQKTGFRQEIALASVPEPATLSELQLTNTGESGTYTDSQDDETSSVAELFREKILNSEPREKAKRNAFDIADAGINGINRLLGWEMTLDKSSDSHGTVKSVNFNSRLLKFNAPVKKNEADE